MVLLFVCVTKYFCKNYWFQLFHAQHADHEECSVSQKGSIYENIECSQPCSSSLTNVSTEEADEYMQTDTVTFPDETDNSFHELLKDPYKSVSVRLVTSLWIKLK